VGDRVESYAGVVTPWWAGKSATAVSMDVIGDGRETVPSDELFVRAGLANWNVKKEPLFITGQHAQKLPDVVATVRGLDGAYLGYVSPSYPIVQNEVMKGLGDAIMGEGAFGVTAGSLLGGRVAWMLFKLDRDAIRIKGDPSAVDMYFLMRTGHDARHGLGGDITPVRVVCWNTLQSGQESAVARVFFRHTTGIEKRIEELRKEAIRALGIVPKAVERFEHDMNVLASKPMTIDEVIAFTEVFLPVNPEVDKPFKTEAQRRELLAVYQNSSLLDGVAPSAYRVFNAVAEWTDHVRPYTDGKRLTGSDKRAISIIDGFAATKKEVAMRLLVKA
jgi:phage/plasmid-like protein (TIGR03299 family)